MHFICYAYVHSILWISEYGIVIPKHHFESETLFYGSMKITWQIAYSGFCDKYVFSVSGALIEMYTSTPMQHKTHTKKCQLGPHECVSMKFIGLPLCIENPFRCDMGEIKVQPMARWSHKLICTDKTYPYLAFSIFF